MWVFIENQDIDYEHRRKKFLEEKEFDQRKTETAIHNFVF